MSCHMTVVCTGHLLDKDYGGICIRLTVAYIVTYCWPYVYLRSPCYFIQGMHSPHVAAANHGRLDLQRHCEYYSSNCKTIRD